MHIVHIVIIIRECRKNRVSRSLCWFLLLSVEEKGEKTNILGVGFVVLGGEG